MYVYLQAYEQGVPAVQPLVAFVGFYRGQNKMFETQPVKAAQAWNNHVKTMPLKFSIGLNSLPPGKYDCQVTVLDPTGQKAAFWRAPIVVVP